MGLDFLPVSFPKIEELTLLFPTFTARDIFGLGTVWYVWLYARINGTGYPIKIARNTELHKCIIAPEIEGRFDSSVLAPADKTLFAQLEIAVENILKNSQIAHPDWKVPALKIRVKSQYLENEAVSPAPEII